jgi:predicted O-methyltransferase YrrM
MIDGDQTLSEALVRFLRATGPTHTEAQRRMAAFADEQSFPNLGPDAGAVLRLVARLTDAETVFEFGSGFGYSASWFLRGGAGRVILTEHDADELQQGREFLADAGLAEQCVFEHGDAMETVDRYGGPFDAVLIDHQKSRYADAFAAVRSKLPDGGVIVADNVTRGPADFEAVLAHLEDGTPLPEDDQTVGVADYLQSVRAADDFETLVLPVGSGLCVSTKVE